MARQRPGWPAAALTAAGLLVLLWATSTGAPLLRAPVLPGVAPPTGDLPPETDAPRPAPTATATEPAEGQRSLQVDTGLLEPVVVLVLLLAAVLLARRLIRARPAERVRGRCAVDAAAEPLLDPAQEADQRSALVTGSPRNAIVACWLRLEDAVARAGVAPRPSETSTELTTRVLSERAVDPGAITALAALYREARFSTHELGERHREQALDLLQTLHGDLRDLRDLRELRGLRGRPGDQAGRTPGSG